MMSTIAGNGKLGFSGDGGPATAAELAYPSGISIDAAGNLYINDYYNLRVRKISPAGIISTVAGNGTVAFTGDGGLAVDAGLDQPTHAVADVAGSLYIADSLNNVIRKVDASTDVNLFAGDGFDAGTSQGGFSGDGGPATKAELNIPEGIALDAAGDIFIADMVNARVRKVSVGGSSITFATPTLAGTTDATEGPQTITVSNAGSAALSAVAPGIKLSANFEQVPGTGKPKDCTVTFSLAPKGSSGKVTGTLSLTDNNQNATSSTQTIALTGTVKSAGG
jgi:hypothetical protein